MQSLELHGLPSNTLGVATEYCQGSLKPRTFILFTYILQLIAYTNQMNESNHFSFLWVRGLLLVLLGIRAGYPACKAAD